VVDAIGKKCLRRMSPGTGNIRSPTVHSPLEPAFPPIGGLPPTSTMLKTSTSSWTKPERARAMEVESELSCSSMVEIEGTWEDELEGAGAGGDVGGRYW